MSATAVGQAGQVRVGGRVAAELGAWTLHTTGHGPEGTPQWEVAAPVKTFDDWLLDAGGIFELRLEIGQRIWRWKGVNVFGRDQMVINGEGHPERL
jgi:hypothetical protein